MTDPKKKVLRMGAPMSTTKRNLSLAVRYVAEVPRCDQTLHTSRSLAAFERHLVGFGIRSDCVLTVDLVSPLAKNYVQDHISVDRIVGDGAHVLIVDTALHKQYSSVLLVDHWAWTGALLLAQFARVLPPEPAIRPAYREDRIKSSLTMRKRPPPITAKGVGLILNETDVLARAMHREMRTD